MSVLDALALKQVTLPEMEEEVDLEVGDCVCLNSNGPIMTILDISNGFYTCIWFTSDQHMQSARFNPLCVYYIPPGD